MLRLIDFRVPTVLNCGSLAEVRRNIRGLEEEMATYAHREGGEMEAGSTALAFQ